MTTERQKEISYADLKRKISQGWDWEDFQSKFGYSKTRLKRHIRQNLCKNEDFARGIIKDIENNSKRKQRQLEHQQRKESQDIIDAEPLEVKSERATSRRTKRDKATTPSEKTIVPSSNTVDADKLAGLRWEEASQSKALDNLSRKLQKSFEQKTEDNAKLHALTAEYDQHVEALISKAKEYFEFCTEVQKRDAAISNLVQKKQEIESALVDIRKQIADLEVVKVFAYKDGTLEPLDSDFVLDDTGYEELSRKLISQDDYQDLRGRDINMLARLYCAINNSNRQIEATFENEDLEQVFTKLRAS